MNKKVVISITFALVLAVFAEAFPAVAAPAPPPETTPAVFVPVVPTDPVPGITIPVVEEPQDPLMPECFLAEPIVIGNMHVRCINMQYIPQEGLLHVHYGPFYGAHEDFWLGLSPNSTGSTLDYYGYWVYYGYFRIDSGDFGGVPLNETPYYGIIKYKIFIPGIKVYD